MATAGKTREPSSTAITPSNLNRRGISTAYGKPWRAMQMHRLDPVTAELVRLRAANYHDCHT